MRVLFVHQNFPGQFKHLAPWLLKQGHDVVGMGDAPPVPPPAESARLIAPHVTLPSGQR